MFILVEILRKSGITIPYRSLRKIWNDFKLSCIRLVLQLRKVYCDKITIFFDMPIIHLTENSFFRIAEH